MDLLLLRDIDIAVADDDNISNRNFKVQVRLIRISPLLLLLLLEGSLVHD